MKEIPEHECKRCFIGITNPYQIEKERCHDCLIFELGEESVYSQREKLKELGLNKHKLKGEEKEE